jgi:hypothetical protein
MRIGVVHVGLEHLQTGWPIACLKGGVTELLQCIDHKHPNERLVVYDQNRLTSVGSFDGRLLRILLVSIVVLPMAREIDAHHGALTKLGIDPHTTTGLPQGEVLTTGSLLGGQSSIQAHALQSIRRRCVM